MIYESPNSKTSVKDPLPLPLEVRDIQEKFMRYRGFKNLEDWKLHKPNYSESLAKIPDEYIRSYNGRVLSALISSGGIKQPEDWEKHANNFLESLDKIPPEHRKDYTWQALPELIRVGGLKTPQDWTKYLESLDKIPHEHRKDYTWYALPELIRVGGLKTPQDWTKYCESLDKMPPEYRTDYTWHVLPDLMGSGGIKQPDDWEKHAKNYWDSMEDIPPKHRQYYTRGTLRDLIKTGHFSWDIACRLEIIREYTRRYGDLDFIWKAGLDNLGRLHPITSRGRPLGIKKDGSELWAFDGRLSGVLIRKITKTAYDAWVKASQAGIKCEQIMKYEKGERKGQYRSKMADDGQMIVFCLYGGENIHDFQTKPENNVYQEQIRRQAGTFDDTWVGWQVEDGEIAKELKDNRIDHGHLHKRNYVVSVIDGKPIVRVIDFDNARLK